MERDEVVKIWQRDVNCYIYFDDKDNAYMSYDIATIYKDVPMEINISDIK